VRRSLLLNIGPSHKKPAEGKAKHHNNCIGDKSSIRLTGGDTEGKIYKLNNAFTDSNIEEQRVYGGKHYKQQHRYAGAHSYFTCLAAAVENKAYKQADRENGYVLQEIA
jgi:hypothetical protein